MWQGHFSTWQASLSNSALQAMLWALPKNVLQLTTIKLYRICIQADEFKHINPAALRPIWLRKKAGESLSRKNCQRRVIFVSFQYAEALCLCITVQMPLFFYFLQMWHLCLTFNWSVNKWPKEKLWHDNLATWVPNTVGLGSMARFPYQSIF